MKPEIYSWYLLRANAIRDLAVFYNLSQGWYGKEQGNGMLSDLF